MPVNLSIPSGDSPDYRTKDYGYKYPKRSDNTKLDLRPGTELHTKLLNRIMEFAENSHSVISKRHNKWQEVDNSLTAYVDLDETEEAIQQDDERKPVRIVIPVQYATLETFLSYFSSTFLTLPYFKYAEAEPGDAVNVMLLEHVIMQQSIRSKMGLDMHTAYRDGFAYSMGIVIPNWVEKMAYRTQRTADGEKFRMRYRSYEGNELISIDPFNFLPDPNTPLEKIQQSEFLGWIERSNIQALLTEENQSDGLIFNMKYVKDMGVKTSRFFKRREQGRAPGEGGDLPENLSQGSPTDRISMFVNLIPSDWKLGPEEYPQIWQFQVCGDSVITMAEQIQHDHNMIPAAVFSPEYDGHSISPVSKMEIAYGMQHALDWFINSRIANVRKAINDMFIVDPYLVNIDDVRNPKPGKLIRLRRAAWGRGVKDAIQQFPVGDVTASHINDVGLLMDLISRTTGATDALQGIMRTSGERRSATEARETKLSALNRVAKSAKIASLQMHYDIAYMLASNTRQYMEDETYIRFVGEKAARLQAEFGQPGRIVSPKDLDIDFDVLVTDDSEMHENAQDWIQLFQIAGSNENIASRLDMFRVFQHIARILGAKNVEDFEIKARVAQPQEIEKGVQNGNLVPAGEVPTGNFGQ